MDKMIKIKASLLLYKGVNKRTISIKSGYRPLFSIMKESKISGHIELLDKTELKPGEKTNVKILFLNSDYITRNKIIDKTVYFYESKEALGEIKCITIL